MPPELLGPFALTAGLGFALAVLWREHLKADQDDRDQRNLAQGHLAQLLQNNADAIAAWNRRNEQDAARERKSDKARP